jgi:hypothetical protein
MNLLKLLKEFVFPENKSIMTEKGVHDSIEEDYSFFKKYHVTDGQLYLIYLGLFSDDINQYLEKNKSKTQDYFLINPDDYIQVLGFINKDGQKYILLVAFEPNYDRKVGNFIAVENWPSFQNYEKKIEDSHWEVYNEFKDKV